jgi:hypothetical protein
LSRARNILSEYMRPGMVNISDGADETKLMGNQEKNVYLYQGQQIIVDLAHHETGFNLTPL